MVTFLFYFSDWGVLLLRLAFGIIFFAHGWAKIKNLKQTQGWFESIGFKPGIFWGTLVALVEVVGAVLIALGLLTQIVALFLALVMIVAMTWKIRNGSKLTGANGYEFDLILLGVAVALLVNGGGSYSLDAFWSLILF